jgi:oligopeptide/dipeptide ABC transporter ATP-binding protein
MAEPIVSVENLKKIFPLKAPFLSGRSSHVVALDGVKFSINRGETLGLVGESGCGKSTLSRLIARLDSPTTGKIMFKGQDIASLHGHEFQTYRKSVQLIFQDPYASLNPRMTAADIVGEPLIIHGEEDSGMKVQEILEVVGINADQAKRYPHEFSGGQRQRIGIARALALNPELVIADEPVSALDVSIQAQVLNLMKDLQERYSLTYLFITHDLSVVSYMSERIAVMYLGRIVEIADRDMIFDAPAHPYTRILLAALPTMDPAGSKKEMRSPGEPPNPVNPPSGCYFHPRCSLKTKDCEENNPALLEVKANHWVACNRMGKER